MLQDWLEQFRSVADRGAMQVSERDSAMLSDRLQHPARSTCQIQPVKKGFESLLSAGEGSKRCFLYRRVRLFAALNGHRPAHGYVSRKKLSPSIGEMITCRVAPTTVTSFVTAVQLVSPSVAFCSSLKPAKFVAQAITTALVAD